MGFWGLAAPSRVPAFIKFGHWPSLAKGAVCLGLLLLACFVFAPPLLAQQPKLLAAANRDDAGESSSRRKPRANSSSQRTLNAPSRPSDVAQLAVPDEKATAVAAPSPQLSVPQSPSQPFIIERIEFVGNRRYPRDTLKSRIFSREGDVLNDETLNRDFQALWNTQYFEDIRCEIEESPNRPDARIVVYYLKERPKIRNIDYKGLKSVTVSDVLERFKERKVGLQVENLFDPTRIKRAEVILKELLAEHGRQYASVRPTYERIAATNSVKLIFNIDEGPKVKVGDIIIEGNTAFSDRRIIRAMRNSRPYAVPMWLFDWNVMSKTYDRRKLAEDLEIGIRSLYQDHGYFQVLVKEPIVENVDINRSGLPGPWPFVGKKQGKSTKITIPIQEGDLYRMGKLFVVPSDPDKGLFFKTEFLQQFFPIKEGEILAVDKIRKAFEDYKKLYGNYGFIDFTSEPDFAINQEKKIIDVTLRFDEQKSYYVRRIEFSGNTTTRDKVIRREVLLDEGDLYNTRLWEVSVLRLNQLDFFEQIKHTEHTEVRRNIKEGSVDLTLKVKEKGKQSIGLQGGVSGIAGSFIGFSYQTNNFLGLGETLTFSADFGDRQRNFVFGFTEPYFLDRPISVGFTLFSNRFSYNQARETSILIGQQININPDTAQNYDQKRKGISLFASYPMRRWAFARVGLTYSYTGSDIKAFSQASQLLFENLQFRQLAGPSNLAGIRSSRISPTISYNTVDNPMNPTSGKSFFYSFGMEGGVLGGNVNTLTQTFEGKYFRPINKRRNVIGVRLMSSFATGYGGIVLPPFNRWYIGGEDSVRGFDYFTVSPWAFIPRDMTVPIVFRDPTQLGSDGQPVSRSLNVPMLDYVATLAGGDTQAVGNFEYRIPIVGPVTLALFLDVGINGVMRKTQLQLDPIGVDRLRQIFPGTTISNQLKIMDRSNFRPRASTGVEVVVQLPIVNAPFRLYWAYNALRFKDEIVEPRGAFHLSQELINTLPPGVYQTQVLPQLNQVVDGFAVRARPFEPLKTFRFTVSRTF